MGEKAEVYKAVTTISETVADFIKNLASLIETGALEKLDAKQKQELARNMYVLSERLINLRDSINILCVQDEKTNGGGSGQA